MTFGFIGSGKITSSIVYGISKSKLKSSKIYISSGNRLIASHLSKKFKFVKVLKDNQEIINKSQIIFLAITPTVGNKILGSLHLQRTRKS